jgi:hypothetical protein
VSALLGREELTGRYLTMRPQPSLVLTG